MFELDHEYIMPDTARKKMQNARQLHQNVYIFAVTTYGKTQFVHHFLEKRKYKYLSCKDDWDCSVLEEYISGSKSQNSVIVIDDIHLLYDEAKQHSILDFMNHQEVWMILIGRSQMPSWMIPAHVRYGFTIISEQDLHISVKEMKEFNQRNGKILTDDQYDYLVEAIEGNGYIFRYTMRLLSDGKFLTENMEKQILNTFAEYLEKEVIPLWDIDVQEFLMQVSVVDQFDIELAQMITGSPYVLTQIEKARAVGNFLLENDGSYSIRPQLLLALQHHAAKVYGLEKIKDFQYNAGLYYETKEMFQNALNLYEKCGHKNRIREILIRNARYNPGAGYYYELRDYYFQLSEEDLKDSPVLMTAMSMLYSILLQPEESEYWYNRLKEYADRSSGGVKREALSRMAYLDIGLPHRGINGIIECIMILSKMIKARDFTLPEFSVTSNMPSLMNGGKDFCEWSKKDRELAATIGKTVSLVLGKYGKGLVNVALGESFYEKGINDYEVLNKLAHAQMEAENGGKIEMLFSIVGITVRMNILNNELQAAREQIISFEEKLKKQTMKENHGLLKENLQALKCRIDLRDNNTHEISEWMKQAPDENMLFYILERYRYMTKIRCYILMREYKKAYVLIERMMFYAEKCDRTYIKMELNLLKSILSYRCGKEWKEEFLDTLMMIHDYSFIRIISEEGVAILPLLEECNTKFNQEKKGLKIWWSKVLKETRQMAEQYPGYMTNGVSVNDFSTNALTILKLQSEGKTIQQMAEMLGLSPQAIKYHSSENYRKLGARGKVDAVQKARSLRLI